MRLVIVNPNTTSAVTDMLVGQARQVADPGVEIGGVTAASGVPAIESRAEAVIAGHAVMQAFADAGDADAGIVAAFADPGLSAAREMMSYPVVGIGEASMLTACLLGRRFAVVTAGNTASAIEEQAQGYGLRSRFAGVCTLDASLLDIAGNQATFDEAIVEIAADTVKANGAEVIILGGAVFVGMAQRLKQRIPVPVIDPIQCAVVQASALVRLRLTRAT